MGTTARETARIHQQQHDAVPTIESSRQDDEEIDEEGGIKRARRSPWEPTLLLLLLQRCRICAGLVKPAMTTVSHRDGIDDNDDTKPIMIFDNDDGRSKNLQRNIQKYLHITVSSEDRLPKVVCTSCFKKLDSIHSFATMALKSQDRLKQEFLRTNTDSVVAIDSSDSSNGSSTNKHGGDRGLLHSILTKGSVDTSNDAESVPGRQRTPSTEEMEVKIDPMLFLQCALERPSSADYSDYSDESVKEINSYDGPISESQSLADRNHSKTDFTQANDKVRSRCRDSNDNENPVIGAKRLAIDDPEYEQDEFEEEEEEEDEDEEVLAADDDDLETEEASGDEPRPYACKLCGRSFASQLGLQNHLWSHLPTTRSEVKDSVAGCAENGHLPITSYICPICGKRISTKGNLKVHLETHRPKGKYGCDICGRIFKTQSNLFRHKEYHSSVQFPCGVCGRVYPTNSTLRAHSITHSDLRPHACPLCDKTFKRNQDLKFHINQHTGARPYQCPYCPKAFASSGNCFSHRKRMHPKEVNRDRQRAADLMR